MFNNVYMIYCSGLTKRRPTQPATLVPTRVAKTPAKSGMFPCHLCHLSLPPSLPVLTLVTSSILFRPSNHGNADHALLVP